jgi:hypothetical protein
MRRKGRIVNEITRLNEAHQRVPIPTGPCELDEGPVGRGPYTLYWFENGKELSTVLSLAELTTTVVREFEQPSRNTGISARS